MTQTFLELQADEARRLEFNAVGCYYDFAKKLEVVDVRMRTPAQNVFLYNFDNFQFCVRSHVSEKILSEWKQDVHIAYVLAYREWQEKKTRGKKNMDISGKIAGNPLKADDVRKNAKWKMGSVKEKVFREGEDAKMILALKNGKEERDLVLNNTNLKKIAAKHGTETDAWLGKEIELKLVTVTNPQTREEVDGIRVA